MRTIRGSSWLLRARLVYCWNLTGTKVTNFSLLRHPFCIWMITSPWAVAFTENILRISHQKKRLCFVIPVKLLANGTERMLGRESHDKTELVLYIEIIIMFARLTSLIFIPITYYYLFHVFLPFPKDKKQSSRGTNHNIGRFDLVYFI